ncbi:hypothetical protein SBADM41S_00587 [Streptomyces badius]
MSSSTDWPLWEVFVRSRRGLSHTHAGSLHAPDAEMALRNARDLYTRRSEGVSIWVIPSTAITASSPDEKDSSASTVPGSIRRSSTSTRAHPTRRWPRSPPRPTPC